MQARSVATSRRPSAGLSSAARSTSLITATPPPRRRFACATPGSRAATRSSAQTALYAACQRALQPGGVLIATSGRLARIADTPMPPCCLPPSMASVPTSAIPRRSPCSACPCLREACTRKQCITAVTRAGATCQSTTLCDRRQVQMCRRVGAASAGDAFPGRLRRVRAPGIRVPAGRWSTAPAYPSWHAVRSGRLPSAAGLRRCARITRSVRHR